MSDYCRTNRLRSSRWMRSLFTERSLSPSDLILPLFVSDQKDAIDVPTMPGIIVYPITQAVKVAKQAWQLGIPALCLFPRINEKLKTDDAKEAYNPQNAICNAIRAIKAAVPEIGLIADVALDPYTSHGHDGLLGADGQIDNLKSVEALSKQALCLARAGCDIIAPSDMMDGRVCVIRNRLDEQSFYYVHIMSYVKYASSFYGPFRHAVGSFCSLDGANKESYQLNIANSAECIQEAMIDIEEGADSIIMKPALPYLDMLSVVANEMSIPVICYQVSGEYAALKFASLNGALDYRSAQLEALIACKRAGARAIITYAATEVARWLS